MIHTRKIDLLQRKVCYEKKCYVKNNRNVMYKKQRRHKVTSLLYYFLFLFAACNVLYNKDTIVIGPTPPGTGVIFEAFL